jgi:hypothetical protein
MGILNYSIPVPLFITCGEKKEEGLSWLDSIWDYHALGIIYFQDEE